jgi:hypothetical protein
VTDERAQKWANGYQAIDLALLAFASELDAEYRAGTWKTYTFSSDYPVEKKQGCHPTTFGAFLEGHSFDIRARGHDASRGELEELLDVYRWGILAGASLQALAFIGLALLKQIHRQYKRKPLEESTAVLRDAFEGKRLNGAYFLPSFAPEGRVTFSVETTDLGDGTYQLVALIATKDGVAYKNRWPKELLHFLCKRMRASNITRESL